MEKVMILLWRPAALNDSAFRQRLAGPVADALGKLGAQRLQLNTADEAVQPAQQTRQVHGLPAFDAVLSLWLDSAARQYKAVEACLRDQVAGLAAYLVTESEPLRNTRHATEPGQRTPGYSQVVLLQRPPRLAHAVWRDYWLNTHTDIAIRTQSTFRYVQNLVVRSLSCAAPPWDGLVEECFPAAAMTSSLAFYAAGEDETLLRSNRKAMIESCLQFIDFDRIQVIPTSEYRLWDTA